MKQVQTIEKRKRSFLTWLLIFVMVFNSLPLDVLAEDLGTVTKDSDYSYLLNQPWAAGEVITWTALTTSSGDGENSNPVQITYMLDGEDIGYYWATTTDENSPYSYSYTVLGQEVLNDPTKTLQSWTVIRIDNGYVSGGYNITGIGLSANYVAKQYMVTFVDDDGTTVLKAAKSYDYGTPAASIEKPENPTKEADAQYTYTFAGWDPELETVSRNIVYKASYNKEINKYTVSWNNYNGVQLEKDTDVPYGEMPEYNGNTPTRVNDAEYTYSFKGWTPAVETVKGDAVYTASFNQSKRKYNITWKNDDGTTIDTTEVEYGVVPTHADPTKPATDEYTYTFKCWEPDVVAVTGDATYTASYNAAKRKYTVKWVNWDDSVLETDLNVEYGTTPTYDKGSNPTKPDDTEHTYTFTGWNPEVGPITGDTTYKAQFTNGNRQYEITFVDDDGETVLKAAFKYDYGTLSSNIVQPNKPTKAPTAQYTYTFAGWDPVISTVTKDQVYRATYLSTVNKYTVSWNNYNGVELERDTDVPYGTMPEYNGNTPTREEDTEYKYTFKGWTPEVETVKGDTVYTASFNAIKKTYTVSWNNYNGQKLADEVYEYGDTPEYKGATPTKPSTVSVDYVHEGWTPAITRVTGDQTYTATFAESPRKYTITWKNYDNTTITTSKVAYGEMPAYTGATPTKPSTDRYSYTFKGWTPDIVSVTQDATYTAVYDEAEKTFTVIWMNYDGTVLEKDTDVHYGADPKYDGATPVHPAEDGHTYSFTGWSPALSPVKKDVTYYATYDNMALQYTVTFVDDDGTTVLKGPDTYAYGTNASDIVRPADPKKASTEQYSYEFAGWSPAIVDVTADAVYKAEYIQTLRTYEITWQNDDGTVLEKDNAAYGTTPEYNGDTPTKKSDDKYSYSFSGWTPDIVPVTGDAVYTAVYDSKEIDNTRKYLIKFVDSDGVTVLKEAVEYDYGTPASEIKQPSTPYKAADDQYEYSFAGWSPTLARVTKDQTYKAVYNATPIVKKSPEPKEEEKDEPSKPSVPPVTTAAPANVVKSPQTGEDNRRMILIGASAFSLSMILLGSLLRRRKNK